MILNNVDKWIDDGINTDHVNGETVEFTCKIKTLGIKMLLSSN